MGSLPVSVYGSFVALAVLLAVAPGPDFAVVLRNAVARGRVAGLWAALGITASNMLQGTLAALGLATFITRSQPLFELVRWLGVAYLSWLALLTLRSAWRPTPSTTPIETADTRAERSALLGLRQGFLSNVTNPKVLAFYLAVLPQFLQPAAPALDGLMLAYIHAAVSLLWLLVVVSALHALRTRLARPRVRRGVETATGVTLAGFAGALALSSR